MLVVFISLAGIAGGSVGLDVVFHVRPIEILCDGFVCFIKAGVSSSGSVMVIGEDALLEVQVVRDVELVFVKKKVMFFREMVR